MRIFTFAILNAVLCACVFVHNAFAENTLRPRRSEFQVTQEVQNKIDFWKLVFAKYGENQLIFHHREHPEIVYSILDLSDFPQMYEGKDLVRESNEAIAAETERIKTLLLSLADGKEPENPAERRIARLFANLPGSLARNYREAATEDQLRNQRGIRERFREGVVRSGRYLHAMEEVFRREGLPLEITRLPLVESSFDYNAYSSVGAAGIWQFMRGTGKNYLRIDSLIDERRDPIAATRAAARYLGNAYTRIGSWPLAITSYNHGVTGVLRAINETGTKDLGTIIRDYKGTAFGFASKNFYAEFMAALECEQNAEQYFPGIQREESWYFDEVKIGRPLSFRELVHYAAASEDDVEKLNRAFMQPILSGRAKIPSGTVVRVPQAHGRRLVQNLGSASLLEFQSEPMLVKNSGSKKLEENIRIAARSPEPDAEQVSVSSQARTAHQIGNPEKKIFVGQAYQMRAGDSLEAVAKKFNVTTEQILEANGFSEDVTLSPGRKILVPVGLKGSDSVLNKTSKDSGGVSGESRGAARHIVRSGENLASIAKSYGMTISDLQKLNPGVTPKKLKAGTKLLVKAEPSSETQETSSSEESRTGKKGGVASGKASKVTLARGGESFQRKYTVQKGDSLGKIAKKLGVSVDRLKELNPGAEKSLRAGKQLLADAQ